MRNSKRGAASLVVVLVLVILAVGAILFFVSKPFGTRVKEAARQATQWTPENIRKDPVGYLTWAHAECGKTEQKLAASTLSLRTQKNQAERSAMAKKSDVESYATLLAEAKAAYRKATEANAWPTEVRGMSLGQAELKKKIVEIHDKLGPLGELVTTYADSIAVITRKLAELETKVIEVRKLKTKLATDLEIAKVRKSVQGIDDVSDKLSAIRDTTDALLAMDTAGAGVEAMLEPVGDTRIDEEFARIMDE